MSPRRIFFDRAGIRRELSQSGSREPLDRAVGYVLRKLRKKAGVSQEEVAAAIGMSRQYLTRLEGGYHSPSVALLNKLAGYYHIPLAELMARIDRRMRR